MMRFQSGLIAGLLCVFLSAGSASAQNSGAEVYNTRCANCHGADGAGKPTAVKMFGGMPDLRGSETQSRTDRQLYDGIGRGFEHKKYPHTFLQTGLTQAEVQNVIAYVRKLSKK